MTTEQLSFWSQAPAAAEPVDEAGEPVEPPLWCPGRIVRDGQALYYTGGLVDGNPQYAPNLEREACYQRESILPADLILSGWQRHPINPVWLTQQHKPGWPWLTTTGATLDETIAKARRFNEHFAELDARAAAQAEKPGRKKTAA